MKRMDDNEFKRLALLSQIGWSTVIEQREAQSKVIAEARRARAAEAIAVQALAAIEAASLPQDGAYRIAREARTRYHKLEEQG